MADTMNFVQAPPHVTEAQNGNQKFCKRCGQRIDIECVVCPKCGKQVEELKNSATGQPNIVINNDNHSSNVNTNVNRNTVNVGGHMRRGRRRSKTVALLLCIFAGYLGAHKFYDGNKKMGILYLCTAGLCGLGWFVDIFMYAGRPNRYYVDREGRYVGAHAMY